VRWNWRVTAMTVLMLVSVVAPAIGGVAGASGFVSLSASAGVDQPIAGDEFEIDATLTSSEDSSQSYEIRRIEVRNGAGPDAETLTAGENLGDLRPGEAVDRSLDVTINESGRHVLVVEATLLSSTGETRTVTQRVTVDVYDRHPRIDASASPARPGDWRTVSVTVENGLTESIRQVEVGVDAEDVTFRSERAVAARIPGTGAGTFEFEARVPENGARNLTVDLTYVTASGDRRTVTRTLSTEFSGPTDPEDSPQLSLSTTPAVGGAWRPVNVTVANGLDQELTGVAVDVESDAVTFESDRRVIATMEAGRTLTFSFSARGPAGRHEVTLTLTYRTADGIVREVERTVTADFTEPANPGRIQLTGVTVRPGRGGLEISGRTSNVGTDAVQSVLVEVVDEENVEPTRPQPEFFVGEVDASDFVPFDLNVRLTGNRTTIPIRVTYIVDGIEKSFVTEIQYEGQTAPAQPGSPEGGGGGGFALVGLVAVVVVLVGLVGVGYVGYRFVRG